MGMIGGLLTICVGGFAIACQIPTNACLAGKVGKFQGGFTSLTIGAIAAFIVMTVAGSGNLGGVFSVPWWHLLGGVCAPPMILANIVAAPVIGVALTVLLGVLGQLSMGVLIDGFGWLGVSPIEVSALRIVGLAITVVGTYFIYRGKAGAASSGGDNGNSRSKMLACMGFVFVAGVGTAAQAAFNAQLAADIGRLESSFVSLFTSALIMFIVALIGNRGKFSSYKGVKPWQFLGGIFGAIMNITTIIATPILGVGLLVTGSLFSQLALGMLIDSRGWFNLPRTSMGAWRWAGVVTIAIGMALVTIARM